jgi:hypothetical protein
MNTSYEEFIRQFSILKDQATEWTVYQAERKTVADAKEAAEVLEKGKMLLEAPNFLDKIVEVLTKRGLAGDAKNAKTIYLDLSSRLLRRPINRLVQGPSGAGKNYLVDSVLALFPEDAFIQITASSERAFVFDDTDFRHKGLVIAESATMAQSSPGAVLLRSFAWGDKITYKITEKQKSGKHVTRTVTKEGPVALITTSVRGVDDEMATRFLTLSIPDTADYSTQIVEEISRQLAGGACNEDVTAFVAAQRWLQVTGVHDVVVPYATRLKDLVSITTVRMRRDYQQLGTTIQASALVHQRQREKDDQQRIIATRRDYEIAYDLVVNPLQQAQGALSDAEVAVVEAVSALCSEQDLGPDEGVSRRAIATRLTLDPDAVRQRLKRPLRLGYIVNLTAGEKGRAGQYRPAGDDGPTAPRPVIPTPDELFDDGQVDEKVSEEDHLPDPGQPGSENTINMVVPSETPCGIREKAGFRRFRRSEVEHRRREKLTWEKPANPQVHGQKSQCLSVFATNLNLRKPPGSI